MAKGNSKKPNTTTNFIGTSSADQISGTTGNDFIDGKEGDDYLYADLGNDNIIGGDGNNSFGYIYGGNDGIDGGAGSYDTVGIDYSKSTSNITYTAYDPVTGSGTFSKVIQGALQAFFVTLEMERKHGYSKRRI